MSKSPNYLKGDVPQSEQSEYVKYVALLRRSLGDLFTQLTATLQEQIVDFLKVEVDNAVAKGLQTLTITLPADVLKRLSEQPELPAFPTQFNLAKDDLEKLKPQQIVLPEHFVIDDASIAKITKEIAKIAPKETTKKVIDDLLLYFKKNPDAWFNVRLTNGEKFYSALAEAFVSASSGHVTSFMGPDGKPALAKLDAEGRIVLAGSATGGLTDAELRASPVPVTGSFTANLDTGTLAHDATVSGVNTTVSGIAVVLEYLRTLRFDVSLSTLSTKLQAIADNTDQLEGYVDQLEGYVDQIEGYIDGLEALSQNTLNTLTSISGRDFATETTLATRASQLTVSGIQQVLEGLRTVKFDVALSTRASEATLATIATQATASGIQQVLEGIRTNDLDVALSTRASETTASGIARVAEAIRQRFDVNLSTIATQATVSGIQQVLESIRTTKFDVNLSTRAAETTASGIAQVIEFLRTNRFTVNQNTLATQTTVSALQTVLQDLRTNGNNGLGVADFDVAIDFANSQTAATIYTPPTGRKWVITDLDISLAAAGTIRIFDNTDTIANRVTQLIGAANGGKVHAYKKNRKSAAADNVLKYTTLSGATGSLEVSGYLV